MNGVRVTLLGGFRVSRDGDDLPVPGARLRGLLIRLALAGGRTVDPSALVDAIWPEDPPAGPAHALQALVSRLRRALGDPGAVEQLDGGYRLRVEPDGVDAVRFDELATTGRDRLHAADPVAASALLTEALSAWPEGPGAEPALIAAVAPTAATRLARLAIEAVVDLAEAELALDGTSGAAARLSALLADHPVHERAAAVLMDALDRQGRQPEALAVYERIRAALADELGADPGTALRERHLRLLRADTIPGTTFRSGSTVFADGQNTRGHAAGSATGNAAGGMTGNGQAGNAVVRAADVGRAVPGNLPEPLTSFFGRDDDLGRVGSLLAEGRLVTVLGPGGAGKTRLALEAARRHRHEYTDGAWLADLSSVTEPAKVAAAVLSAIGLRGSALFEDLGPGRDERDVLADELSGRELLLLVDNCEHLIDAVARLLEPLLARCARLRVLATSREPLAIGGEALVPLGPLPLPELADDLDQARKTAAVRLFAARAAAVRPGFDVDPETLPRIVQITRALDGMPLALELAAARLRTLSLDDLAEGLSDRFRLLTTGSRTAQPRHRTLRAVIAWSWDLLTAHERTVAKRVSILPGGVTVASATAVCAGTEVPPADVPELLAALVDRSLLQLAPEPGRYRMLETIREYGAADGTADARDPAARDLAARYFADLVARLDPRLRGPDQLGALRELRAEYDNILATLRHLCESGDAEHAVRLAVDLTWFWQMFGRYLDAAYWLGEAVAIPVEHPGPAHAIAEGVLLLNTIASENALANGSEQELLALTDRLLGADLPGFGGALIVTRLASLVRSQASPATLQRMIDGPDRWLAGLAHLFRAQYTENEGRLDQVRDDIDAALICFGRAGDRWGLAMTLPMRALLRQYDGDLDGTRADLIEAKRLAREFGSLSLSDEIFIDLRWIDLQSRLGENARAADLLAAARENVLRSASPEMVILLDVHEAGLRVRVGEPERAAELLASAEARLSADLPFGSDRGHALVGAARGALLIATGDGPGATAALSGAYAAAVASGDMPILATVVVAVAGLAAHEGRLADAAVLLGAAARLRGTHDRTDPDVRAVSGRARVALGDDGFDDAYRKGWNADAEQAVILARPAGVST